MAAALQRKRRDGRPGLPLACRATSKEEEPIGGLQQGSKERCQRWLGRQAKEALRSRLRGIGAVAEARQSKNKKKRPDKRYLQVRAAAKMAGMLM